GLSQGPETAPTPYPPPGLHPPPEPTANLIRPPFEPPHSGLPIPIGAPVREPTTYRPLQSLRSHLASPLRHTARSRLRLQSVWLVRDPRRHLRTPPTPRP